MAIRELLIRNFDSTNSDPYLDRMGCRKRGMCDGIFSFGHIFSPNEGLPDFVRIRCDLLDSDLEAYQDFRKPWKDALDYEVTAQNINQGWYDVRVWETAASPTGINAIIGEKATKIQGYLTRWGCINIVPGTNQIAFRFRLSAAVQSQEFWDVTAEQLAAISFVINSYTNGVGTITVTVPQATDPNMVKYKILQRGGTLINEAHPSYTFTIERNVLLDNFKNDLKRKAERTYMFQQHRINSTAMDQAVSSGGVLTLTRAEFLASVRNMAAE